MTNMDHAGSTADELLSLAIATLMERSQWETDERIKKDEQILSTTLGEYAEITLREILGVTHLPGLAFLADSIISHSESEEFIRDLIALMPYIIDSKELGRPGQRNLYVRGISHYGHIESQGKGSYPMRRLSQGSAILRVTAYFKAHGVKNKGVHPAGGQKQYAIIMDSRIRNLLTTSEDPEALADLIIERNLTTYDEIRGVLAAMIELELPLHEGVL